MTVIVQKAGLITTIQDGGRSGFQQYGVNVSGPMDIFAFRAANVLVGNQKDTSLLEIAMIGPILQFQEDTLIALCGGEFDVQIDGETVPLWRPVFVRSGAVLRVGKRISGLRLYLAIAGGLQVPTILGSQSTTLRAKLGGLEGGSLHDGDRLTLGKSSFHAKKYMQLLSKEEAGCAFATTHWSISPSLFPYKESNQKDVRVVLGKEWEQFDEDSQLKFLNHPYRITTQSDRMGYRLEGHPLHLKQRVEMITEAVAMGTIQVPSEGKPIVLMADCQTTGGYPRIAHVISIDIPVIAQAMPGDTISFQTIPLHIAQELMIIQEFEWKRLEQGILLKWKHERGGN